MNIIICGAGRVGFSISKQLSAQGHSITVIDQSSEFIQKINDTQDVKGVVGRATYPSVLEKAGAEDADMIIAVTQNDETNMVICQVAYSIFKEHPVNGIGPRGFRFVYHEYAKLDDDNIETKSDRLNYLFSLNLPPTHPHLLILEVLAETGVIGPRRA